MGEATSSPALLELALAGRELLRALCIHTAYTRGIGEATDAELLVDVVGARRAHAAAATGQQRLIVIMLRPRADRREVHRVKHCIAADTVASTG